MTTWMKTVTYYIEADNEIEAQRLWDDSGPEIETASEITPMGESDLEPVETDSQA